MAVGKTIIIILLILLFGCLSTRCKEAINLAKQAPYSEDMYQLGKFDCSNMGHLLQDYMRKYNYESYLMVSNQLFLGSHVIVAVKCDNEILYFEPTNKKVIVLRSILYQQNYYPIYDINKYRVESNKDWWDKEWSYVTQP